MKDIKINTSGKPNVEIITHALNLGYGMNLAHEPHLLDANYILLSGHQNMRWCDKKEFLSEMSEQMTFSQFMSYGR